MARARCATGAFTGWLNHHIEVQHLLARPKLPAERDGRFVPVVGLDINDPGAALRGDPAQKLEQASGNVPPSMPWAESKVVDVYLAPHSLEFVEFIGNEAAQHLVTRQRHDGDHMLS